MTYTLKKNTQKNQLCLTCCLSDCPHTHARLYTQTRVYEHMHAYTCMYFAHVFKTHLTHRHTHKVNTTAYALDAITNLLLLQRCGVFVGTFSSNFGRLAYELQLSLSLLFSNGSALPPGGGSRSGGGGDGDDGVSSSTNPLPPVSLDFPWFADP